MLGDIPDGVRTACDAAEAISKALPVARSLKHRPAMVWPHVPAALCTSGRANTPQPNTIQVEASQLAAEARDGFYLPLALLLSGADTRQPRPDFRGHGLHARGVRPGQAQQQRAGAVADSQRDRLGVAGDRRSFQGHRIQRRSVEIFPADKRRRSRSQRADQPGLRLLAGWQPGNARRPSKASSRSTSANVGTAGGSMAFAIVPPRPSIGWLGKLDRAEEHARTLLANAEQNSVAKYVAIARRLLGEIAAVSGDHHAAEEELTRSLEPFATYPDAADRMAESCRAGTAAGSAQSPRRCSRALPTCRDARAGTGGQYRGSGASQSVPGNGRRPGSDRRSEVDRQLTGFPSRGRPTPRPARRRRTSPRPRCFTRSTLNFCALPMILSSVSS